MIGGRLLRVLLLMGCGQQVCLAGSVNLPGPTIPECLSLTDSDLPSKHVALPTNITIKPTSHDWQLNFTIHEAEEKETLVCISLGVNDAKIQLLLFNGTCDEKDFEKVQDWRSVYVKPKEWNLIQINKNKSSIILELEGGNSVSIPTYGISLPEHGFVRVTFVQALYITLGCHVQCPPIQGTRPGNSELFTLTEISQDQDRLFIKPGRDFTRLNLEILCETRFGSKILVGETELTQRDFEKSLPNIQWYRIFLTFDNTAKVFEVDIDYQLVRNVSQGLTACYTFRSFLVRAAGETFVSHTCDPTREVDRDVPSNTSDNKEIIVVALGLYTCIATFLLILLVIGIVVLRVKLRTHTNKTQQVETHAKCTLTKIPPECSNGTLPSRDEGYSDSSTESTEDSPMMTTAESFKGRCPPKLTNTNDNYNLECERMDNTRPTSTTLLLHAGVSDKMIKTDLLYPLDKR